MAQAGASIVDITPPAGLAMSGYAARTEPAIGTHDRLTARALAIDDTAIVVADVLGFHEAMSQRIRARCALPDERVVVAALHNHGGPASIAGRVGGDADPAYLRALEDGCVRAIDEAKAAQRPAELTIAMGADSEVVQNRRHPGGLIDAAVPVLRVRGADGSMIAVMTSYACHPVVLGADNRLWTADYPHYVRTALEAQYPGAVALFLTGCAADANTGHTAQASISLTANAERTFATAGRLGGRIATAALASAEAPARGGTIVANATVKLGFERREALPLPALAAAWRAELTDADPARAALLGHWIAWAESAAPPPFEPWLGRVTVLHWGGVPIVALPGEIFAETALAIRQAFGKAPAFVLSYADAFPGYIPPASEFAFGGYEVDEAHRFIGMPATFAPGSAEALAAAAMHLLGN